MNRFRLVSCLVCVTLFAAVPLVATERPRMLIMNLKAETGVSESAARLLNDALLARVQRDRRFEIFGEADLAAMVSLEVTRQQAGCEEIACLAELGGALGATRVLVGSVGKLGERFVLNLKILQIKEARVEARWTGSVAGSEARLLSTVEEAAGALLAEVQLAAPAAVPPVGGQSSQPLTATTPVEPGDRDDSPWYASWPLWAAVGGGAVAVVAGVFLLRGDEAGSQGNGRVGIDVVLPAP